MLYSPEQTLAIIDQYEKLKPLSHIDELTHDDFLKDDKVYIALYGIEDDLARIELYNEVLLQAEKVNARIDFERTYSKYESLFNQTESSEKTASKDRNPLLYIDELTEKDFRSASLYIQLYKLRDDASFKDTYEAVLKRAKELDASRSADDTLNIVESFKRDYESCKILQDRKNGFVSAEEDAPFTKKNEEGLTLKRRTIYPFEQNSDFGLFKDLQKSDLYKPIKTGVRFFDNLNGGVYKQSLNIILALSGVGKTTLCQQIACSLAKSGYPVLYYNFEMSREQLIAKDIIRSANQRIRQANTVHTKNLAPYLNVYDVLRLTENMEKIVNNKILEEEYNQSIKEYNKINAYLKYNYNLNEDANVPYMNNSLSDLITMLDNAMSRDLFSDEYELPEQRPQAPALFIDYLQLLTCDSGNIQEDIKSNVLRLKEYAVKYNTFVFVISAVNRDVIRQDGGHISISSGRDSSNIEYTGDTVISLNYRMLETTQKEANEDKKLEIRRKYYRNKDNATSYVEQMNEEANIRDMRLILLKNRFGAGAHADATFYPEASFFDDARRLDEILQDNEIPEDDNLQKSK